MTGQVPASAQDDKACQARGFCYFRRRMPSLPTCGGSDDLEDKTLACKDCNSQFVFTVREQEFFHEKGFQNEPQRCRECRQSRRASSGDVSRAGTQRPNFEAVCAECGVTTTVPFRPRGDRPVYCRTCFTARVPAPAVV
jgi:CxxC-x17-CxxC domain-containing protein